MNFAVLFTLLLPYCQPNSDAIETQCAIWLANCVNIELVLHHELGAASEMCVEKLPDYLLPE